MSPDLDRRDSHLLRLPCGAIRESLLTYWSTPVKDVGCHRKSSRIVSFVAIPATCVRQGYVDQESLDQVHLGNTLSRASVRDSIDGIQHSKSSPPCGPRGVGSNATQPNDRDGPKPVRVTSPHNDHAKVTECDSKARRASCHCQSSHRNVTAFGVEVVYFCHHGRTGKTRPCWLARLEALLAGEMRHCSEDVWSIVCVQVLGVLYPFPSPMDSGAEIAPCAKLQGGHAVSEITAPPE